MRDWEDRLARPFSSGRRHRTASACRHLGPTQYSVSLVNGATLPTSILENVMCITAAAIKCHIIDRYISERISKHGASIIILAATTQDDIWPSSHISIDGGAADWRS